jgi:hypothetical protein
MNSPRRGEVQRAALVHGEDGVWDVALGVILLTIGTVELLALHPLWMMPVILVMPLARLVKRRVIARRLRAHEVQRTSAAGAGVAVVILSLMTAVLVAASSALLALLVRGLPPWLSAYLPVVLPIGLAVGAVVILVTVGTMLSAPGRYFVYAAVLAGGFLALLWPLTPDWAPLLLPGVLMSAVGAGLLVRFLWRHARQVGGQLSYPY